MTVLKGATRGEGDLGRSMVMRGQRRWRAANKMEVEVIGVLNSRARRLVLTRNRCDCRRATKEATAGRREGHEVGEARACVESHLLRQNDARGDDRDDGGR